jgi:hypothetical protein
MRVLALSISEIKREIERGRERDRDKREIE